MRRERTYVNILLIVHRKVVWRIPRAVRYSVVALLLCFGLFGLFEQYMGGREVTSHYHPRTTALRKAEITVYAPPVGYASPRAILVFFGNDMGFWAPHRRLAFSLSCDGYAVIGVDIRPVLANLPGDSSLRADAVRRRVRGIIAAGHAEFDGPRADTPLLLAGHSLGAELALWSAASVPVPSLTGVVAMSPGSRSHLRISASDLLMTGEPQEAGSFAVSDMVTRALHMHPNLRIVVVRGSNDPFKTADPALLAAGGPQIRVSGVPLAGHSMKQLSLAGIVFRRALDWLLESSPPPASNH